jgi:hypothetical protein
MTVKRDFKRRVRQRQARTGESYVTARRHMLASRPGGAAADDRAEDGHGDGEAHTDAAASTATATTTAAPQPAIDEVRRTDRAAGDGSAGEWPGGGLSVVELVDVSEEARRAGLVCRVLMYPPLPERIAPARTLTRLREVLIAMVGDPATALLSALALAGQPPPRKPHGQFDVDALGRFLQRARAGLGGALDDGTALAFHVATGDRMLPILCAVSARGTTLELSSIEDLAPEAWLRLGRSLPIQLSGAHTPQGLELVRVVNASLGAHPGRRLLDPPLFILHGGQRHTVTRTTFVIGRASAGVHLALDASHVADRHALVILTRGSYYLKDLDGAVFHKGMRIDTKRIDEGDVFQIGDTEIRFTYQPG